jgi:hypothetical protein
MTIDVKNYPVSPPRIVAIASQPGLKPTYKFSDPDLPGTILKFGEDYTFGTKGVAPNGEDVGATESELAPKMRHLLDYFAIDDNSGMASRVFRKFLAKQIQPGLYTDKDLDKAVADHENFHSFAMRAFGAPKPFGSPPPAGTKRIHQALMTAKWDINQLVAPSDLGAPAFNLGDKYDIWENDATGDWANGLAVMIDAVQYVYVIATHYYFDRPTNYYYINLKFMGYDVFGLDDADIDKYGAKEDNCTFRKCDMGVGITAWWQLQHQHNYAPLISRFVVERSFFSQAT